MNSEKPMGKFWQALRGWFLPGLGVKRWMLVTLAGITFLGVGLALLLLDFYRVEYANETFLTVLSYVSLRFLPRLLRVLIFGGIGLGVTAYGIWGLNRALLRPFMKPGRNVLDQVAEYNRRSRGPRIVAIGGGHGLATLLRGLKEHTRNLTAIVTVADDGGSSGRLRESFGILPPGDIRNCLAALSNDEAMLTQLFQYRFSGEPGLDGHSFGNLFISALSDITGSFEEAVAESGRVLSVSGRVLPSTLHDVKLVADIQLPHVTNEVRVEGESHIPEAAGRVRRVWLEPNDASAFPPALKAILNADLILVGPGSLYTSILPNLLVRDLLAAIRSSRAIKIFICNIATQTGETDEYSCHDHIRALEEHVGANFFDVALCNDNYVPTLPAGTEWVRADAHSAADSRVYCADLFDEEQPWRHDSAKLGQTLMNLFYERTGPLS
ncbi:MAG: YvcK family protein [Anaerolineales bacterium]|nr:YvcK family protein [Anaerolineales bacterium]MCZ2287435.1 YvcK family protein [Anaerolineales bacterium]